MSILWGDNWGSYGTNTAFLLNGLYAECDDCNLVVDPDPNATGSTVLRLNVSFGGGGAFAKTRWVLPAAHATVGVGQRVWLAAIPDTVDKRPWPVMWRDAGNAEIARIQVTPTGAVAFYNNSALIATTSGPVLTANAWHHLEARLVCGTASNATFELRKEGSVVLTASGFTTTSATVAQIALANDSDATSLGVTLYSKDLVIWDGAGTNNNFIGSVSVYRSAVNVDISSGWTRSSGTSDFALLDETPPVDAGFISAPATLPEPSIMGFADLPPDIVSVRALISLVRMSKTDGGDGSVQVSLSPDGTAWDAGPVNPITTAMTYWTDVSELSPATGAAWTPAEANNGRIRINRTL